MRKLVVLRGVPGTGKSTWATKYYEKRKTKCPYENVVILNRDSYRMMRVKYSESEYQKSFKDHTWDNSIRKGFWQYFAKMMRACDTLILDTTMCHFADYVALQWHIFEYVCETNTMLKVRWYIFVEEHGSTHGVPGKIINDYWDQFNDTIDYVGEPKYVVIDDKVVELDEKWCYEN